MDIAQRKPIFAAQPAEGSKACGRCRFDENGAAGRNCRNHLMTELHSSSGSDFDH